VITPLPELEALLEILVSQGYNVRLGYRRGRRRGAITAPRSQRLIAEGGGSTWRIALANAVRAAHTNGWPIRHLQAITGPTP
jgi:hypothetical protein